MYKITFVRLFRIEHYFKCGYLGRRPNKGFFKKEFNSLEEAVKFVVGLPNNIWIRSFDNFSKKDLRVFRSKVITMKLKE